MAHVCVRFERHRRPPFDLLLDLPGRQFLGHVRGERFDVDDRGRHVDHESVEQLGVDHVGGSLVRIEREQFRGFLDGERRRTAVRERRAGLAVDGRTIGGRLVADPVEDGRQGSLVLNLELLGCEIRDLVSGQLGVHHVRDRSPAKKRVSLEREDLWAVCPGAASKLVVFSTSTTSLINVPFFEWAMKVVLIGVGQAGGKLTEELVAFDERMGFESIQGALAINSATADLQPLSLDTVLIGQSTVKGHGVGGDNELGAEIMASDIGDVTSALDGRITSRSEAIFVVAGLGGGTGSGGAPVLVRELSRVYDVPVYGLCILPGRNEGAMYQANAGRSLLTIADEADSTLVIDNDAWHSQGESVTEAFDAINQRIAQRVGLLLAAGEIVTEDGGGRFGRRASTPIVAESVVDTSEIVNTLRAGDISALGFASAEASEEASENINVISSITRRAVLTGMSLSGATTADAALVVIAGQPERIARKGVETARRWVEEQTGSMQVRGGDFPLESERLAAIVVLSGLERSEPIRAFMERATEAQNRRPAVAIDHATHFRVEELEDLF